MINCVFGFPPLDKQTILFTRLGVRRGWKDFGGDLTAARTTVWPFRWHRVDLGQQICEFCAMGPPRAAVLTIYASPIDDPGFYLSPPSLVSGTSQAHIDRTAAPRSSALWSSRPVWSPWHHSSDASSLLALGNSDKHSVTVTDAWDTCALVCMFYLCVQSQGACSVGRSVHQKTTNAGDLKSVLICQRGRESKTHAEKTLCCVKSVDSTIKCFNIRWRGELEGQLS